VSQRIAATYVRVEFTAAVRRAAWARCGGKCEQCGKPLDPGKYRYDHTVPARRGGPSTIDNCKVLCRDGPSSCDAIKTHSQDLPGIAAVKRYGKNRLPLDIDRPAKTPSKIRSPGFQQGHRPISGRSTFDKRQRQ
jgi:5-methylcytosine-specific restriction endonuclease McrA